MRYLVDCVADTGAKPWMWSNPLFEHPEEYKTLSVRVSGWNARFVTLNKEWQDMIIERTSGGTL